MTSSEVVGSAREVVPPAVVDVASGARASAVYRASRFTGSIYNVRGWTDAEVEAVQPLVAALMRRLDLKQGYEEQAAEALWFAEASIAATAEVLPPDEN